tara:strand:- start:687 stop:1790 length:1104 start_codon:yes stop_codon:yes gene_type:complete
MKRITLAEPFIKVKETSKIIKKALNSNFPNEGEQTKQFERKICNLLKVKYAITTTSGTAAIFLALKANGIRYGDEVIIPNITFPATANAVVMTGAKPVLVDINPKNLLIDEKALIKKINKKTKFVIPVHVSGRGNNIENIIKICRKKSIKVIEDAAEAFGSKYGKKSLGTFGISGCFSFAPNKIITTGQGGAVITDNKKIYLELLRLKDQGRLRIAGEKTENFKSKGYNFKFTNLQSSLGISQLNNIKWRIKKLKNIHQFYLKNIDQNSEFRIIDFDFDKGELPLWTDVYCEKRDKLFNFLKIRNIICRYYWEPINNLPPYKASFNKLLNSKKIYKKMMWLPSSLHMNIKQQQKVCKLINIFLKKTK